MDKIKKRLSAWQGQLLSMGGKITLIRHILCSMPLYSLIALDPPASVLQKLESLFANFLWGSTDEGPRHHWVSWDTICRPTPEGGAGIRRLSDISTCLRLKQVWQFHTTEALWVQYICGKYLQNTSFASCSVPARCSSTWRSMLRVRTQFYQLSQSIIFDGSSSFLDSPSWLEDFGPLRHYTVENSELPADVSMLTLKDLVDGNGVWQLNSVQAFLPEPILHEISSTSIFLTVGTDMLVWKPNRTGSFSVKSTWQAIRCRRAELWFSRPEAPLYL